MGCFVKEDCFIFVVAYEDTGLRLDIYLYNKLKHTSSREKVKQAIVDGCCIVNNVVCFLPSKRLKTGAKVIFSFQEKEQAARTTSQYSQLDILYQDEYFVIINKPPGLTVHPGASVLGETLIDSLLQHFPQLAQQEGDRPGVVHRLDKDTSGLICIALTEKARLALIQMFADRLIFKEYLALVHGVPKQCGQIQTNFGRHPTVRIKMAVLSKGKFSDTRWNVLYAGYRARYALVLISIHTGRTHQIRVHMEHIQHPILGDQVYCSEDKKKLFSEVASRQMLHAWKLSFKHPFTGQDLQVSCSPPTDFFSTAWSLEKRPVQVVLTGVAGSGKSLALSMLKTYGVATWSADDVVDHLYSPGGEVWKIFWERYGEVFIPDKKCPIDKNRLWLALSGSLNVSIDVHELNMIVHPFVLQELMLFWEKSFEQGLPYAVAEVPLWFESAASFDQIKTNKPWIAPDAVVGIFCPEEVLHKRLEERSWAIEKQQQIHLWHFRQEQKLKKCSYVIKNIGDIPLLEKEVKNFFSQLEEMAKSRRHDFKKIWGNLVL